MVSALDISTSSLLPRRLGLSPDIPVMGPPPVDPDALLPLLLLLLLLLLVYG